MNLGETLDKLERALGGSADRPLNKSPVLNIIDLACDGGRFEPDLAMNLEVCDMINQKQKNTPHEAAMHLLQYINGRDQHSAMLALNLLDVCVKNCGYPFHLQIASKDFLNEFVRSFPERPPPARTAVQDKILDLIQEWNFGVYSASKFKQDLGHINDMYRLLQYKGYMFPRIKEDATNVMKASQAIKSRQEMEEEDKVAQAAKLQELLRRATPADLAAANDLMKVMVGYNRETLPNYAAKESEQLEGLEEKTNRLLERLSNLPAGTKVTDDVQIHELVAIVKSSQSKITQWIEESINEGGDKVDRLLALNDLMNDVLTRHDNLKTGKAAPSGSASPAKSPAKEPVSLIDLDLSPPPSNSSVKQATSTSPNGKAPNGTAQVDLLGDLAGLSFPAASSSTLNPATSPQHQMLGSIQLDPTNAQFWTSPMLAKKELGSSPPKIQSPPTQNLAPTLGPMISPPGSMARDVSMTQFINVTSTNTSPIQVALSDNIPEKTLLDKNGLKVTMRCQNLPDIVICEAYFSNANSSLVTKIDFLVAVPTSMKLLMEPITGAVLPPKSTNSVMQCFKIMNPSKAPVKIRFKFSYIINNVPVSEQGEFKDF